ACVPHLSLYMLQLKADGLAEAVERLSLIAARTPQVTALAGHYHYSHDYLAIEYAKSDALIAVQEEVISALNPLRNGLRENDTVRLATVRGEERSNILEYGYRSVGSLFKPHLTFTRFMGDQKTILDSLPPKETFNGAYDALGIYEMGEHGTCMRLVTSWTL
ncbi:MAG TPA: DUF1045 domain-containing protein, partial [Candidatus Paceibacterota bacterium]